MATNALSKYYYPDEYRKILEKASHSYDNYITAFNESINHVQEDRIQLKSKISAARTEGLPIRNIKDVNELICSFEALCTQSMSQYLPKAQYIYNVALPVLGVYKVILESRGMINRNNITQPYRITAKEVYAMLLSMNNKDAHLLIRTIACPISVLNELLQAYDNMDEEAFISLIERNECDCIEINKYANTDEAIRASRFSDLQTAVEMNINGEQACFKAIESLENVRNHIGLIIHSKTESAIQDPSQVLPSFLSVPYSIIFLRRDIEQIEKNYELLATELKKNIYWSCFSERSCFSNVEKDVIESILSRPTGIDIYNRYKAEYEAKQALGNREVKTADVNDVEESSGDQTIEVQAETQVGLTLDYSNSEFITFEEFRSMKISENEDEFYIDSKTYTVNEPEYRKSFDNTTLLYEYLCNNKMITHSPDNYYSFLFRMTGRYCSRCEAKSIVFLKEDSSELTYFLGRAIYKRRDSTGTDYSLCDPEKPKRPRYKNGIWQQTYFGDDKRARFFETQKWKDHKPEEPNVIKRISEAAKLHPNPKKKFYQDCNNLCLELFGELI